MSDRRRMVRLGDAPVLVAVWVLGCSGAVAAIRGWGPVVMSPSVQLAGTAALLSLSAVCVGTAYLGASRWRLAPIVVFAGGTMLAGALTAPNVGRAPALVAMASTFAALVAAIDLPPLSGGPPRARPIAGLAVVPLAAAQVMWILDIPVAAVMVGVAASFVVSWTYRSASSAVVPLHDFGIGAAALLATSSVRSIGVCRQVVLRAVTWAQVRWRRSGGTRVAVLLGAGVTAAFAPVFWRLVNARPTAYFLGVNDYDIHLTSARSITLRPLFIDVPHFVFHLSAAGASALTNDRVGPVVVLTAAFAATYWSVFTLFRSPCGAGRALSSGFAAMLAAGYFVLETPTLVALFARVIPDTTRFLSVHWIYSPTWVVAFPFAIWAVVLTERLSSDSNTALERRRLTRWLSVVVTVSALAKPALAVCFVPGLPLYLLVARRRPFGEVVSTAAVVGIPSAAVVIWQTWFLTTGQSEVWGDEFVFDPIGGPVYGWAEARWAFWLPLVWPALALWVTRGRFVSERSTQLVLSCSVFALPIFLLFKESGDRVNHGNLGVPVQLCIVLLVLLSLRAVARETVAVWTQVAEGRRAAPFWLGVTAVATALFLAGGVLSYLDAIGVVRVPINWNPLF